MTYIASASQKITQESTTFKGAVSESLLQTIGGTINFLTDAEIAQISTNSSLSSATSNVAASVAALNRLKLTFDGGGVSFSKPSGPGTLYTAGAGYTLFTVYAFGGGGGFSFDVNGNYFLSGGTYQVSATILLFNGQVVSHNSDIGVNGSYQAVVFASVTGSP